MISLGILLIQSYVRMIDTPPCSVFLHHCLGKDDVTVIEGRYDSVKILLELKSVTNKVPLTNSITSVYRLVLMIEDLSLLSLGLVLYIIPLVIDSTKPLNGMSTLVIPRM